MTSGDSLGLPGAQTLGTQSENLALIQNELISLTADLPEGQHGDAEAAWLYRNPHHAGSFYAAFGGIADVVHDRRFNIPSVLAEAINQGVCGADEATGVKVGSVDDQQRQQEFLSGSYGIETRFIHALHDLSAEERIEAVVGGLIQGEYVVISIEDSWVALDGIRSRSSSADNVSWTGVSPAHGEVIDGDFRLLSTYVMAKSLAKLDSPVIVVEGPDHTAQSGVDSLPKMAVTQDLPVVSDHMEHNRGDGLLLACA